MDELRQRLGKRIRSARTALSLTQQQLAKEASLPAPQVVSQIEKGEREVKAWELVSIARVLRVEIGELLRIEDPSPRPVVRWREIPADNREVREAEFIRDCERYALLERLCGQCVEAELPEWNVDPSVFSYEEVSARAEQVRKEFDFGSRPAHALAGVLEDRYGVKIWYRSLGREGSAASTRGSTGPAILINGDEVPWRRNFSIAHELFHLLTWSETAAASPMTDGASEQRVEELANVFASALLLPEEAVHNALVRRRSDGRLVLADLVEMAREFDVSAQALVYRLLNLKELEPDEGKSILASEAFRALDRSARPAVWAQTPGFPERYVRLAFAAYHKGKLSKARLAELLDVGLADLNSKLEEYGLDETQDYTTELRTA